MNLLQGGSLAKGTAIRGSSDIDLVVFIKDDLDDTVGGARYKDRLEELISVIKHALESKSYDPAFIVKGVKTTKFSVQMDMQVPLSSDWIKVDILPARDNLGSEYRTTGRYYVGLLSNYIYKKSFQT